MINDSQSESGGVVSSTALLCAVLDEKRPHDQLGGMDTLRELLQYWQKETFKSDGMELEQAINDLRCIAKVLGAYEDFRDPDT